MEEFIICGMTQRPGNCLIPWGSRCVTFQRLFPEQEVMIFGLVTYLIRKDEGAFRINPEL